MCPPPKITEFHDFEKVHAILLAASGIPPALHRQLFRKLSTETFDGGDYFTIEQCDAGLQRRLHLSAQIIRKESDLFLIDHAWTFRLSAALKQLNGSPRIGRADGGPYVR
ncbi:hypothetical protein KSP40_PGU008867 [Platanthera guangdongensis]|uniref:Uncharacterized protein n=1 Tax=Platanthera guangdongensis TaxID=2320717 RepID=A0ABR2MZR5_9ASPA